MIGLLDGKIILTDDGKVLASCCCCPNWDDITTANIVKYEVGTVDGGPPPYCYSQFVLTNTKTGSKTGSYTWTWSFNGKDDGSGLQQELCYLTFDGTDFYWESGGYYPSDGIPGTRTSGYHYCSAKVSCDTLSVIGGKLTGIIICSPTADDAGQNGSRCTVKVTFG